MYTKRQDGLSKFTKMRFLLFFRCFIGYTKLGKILEFSIHKKKKI